LLEGLVFGARAAAAMTGAPQAAVLKSDRKEGWDLAPAASRDRQASRSQLAANLEPLAPAEIRDLMWRSVGLFRDRAGLEDAVARLQGSGDPQPSTADEWRHHNLLTVARAIARAALRREESRGGHYREDFPQRDDQQWKIHVVDSGQGTQSSTESTKSDPLE
jgi:L-aspartate oxidase